ncbi:MAG: hypothetical protein WA459_05080 [Stellaceae bacterium]
MTARDSIIERIAVHLASELGDQAAAETLARLLGDDALSWRAPEIATQQIATILAFTFGNRMRANGNREPGPVNEALGEVALRLHRQTGAPIYAQWEVAEAIGERVPPDQLIAIFPKRDERAEPRYLSTSGVVGEVVQRVRDPASLGTVGIVAFADHAWRCVATARHFRLAAAMPAGYAMPSKYDALSGQPWCRSRLAYLLHDIAIRAAERRDAVIAQPL